MPSAIKFSLAGFQVPSLVVHPVPLAVLKYAVITAAGAFPRRIVDQYNLARNRTMQSLLSLALKPVDEMSIDKQLAPRTDIDRALTGATKLMRLSEYTRNQISCQA